MTGEFEIIKALSRKIPRVKGGVIVGIGDDAAVLRPAAGRQVATVDALVEGVHFDLRYCTPEDVGYRALAVNLSDVAAMGAAPRHVLVSLAVPKKGAEKFIEQFYKGLLPLARRHAVQVVGGNLSRSPSGIFVDVVVLGESKQPVLRSGARVGDWIAVVGSLGEAAAGLQLLRKLGRARALKAWPALCRAQLRPTPLVEVGKKLAGIATSLIDISDGLSSELAHLAKASGVSLEIDPSWLKWSAQLDDAAEFLGLSSEELALHGGEDYALLVTGRPADWVKTEKALRGQVTMIGRVVAGRGKVWRIDGPRRRALESHAFDHFRSP
jgi:thiamine-monophosphate kinase